MNDTKSNILDSAEDLIQRVGINAMSYKHISDAVGIRKASIHHHFPKKKDMVDALLSRCEISYGSHYRTIVETQNSAQKKLRMLADVFAQGLMNNKLCLVGMISSDMNTLDPGSCKILEKTVQSTIKLFSTAFAQGRNEGSLDFPGTDREAAYTFFSFLVGNQIAARVKGGETAFKSSTEIIIKSWEV